MRMRTLAATATVIIATVGLAAPASAATRTAADKTGDVLAAASAPKNTQNKNVDITSVTTTATKKAVTVTVKVANVLSDPTHYQMFSAQIVTATPGPWSHPSTLVIGSIQDKTHPTPVCTATLAGDETSKDIGSLATCTRNPSADTVTFTIPTSAIPGASAKVSTNAAAYALVKTADGSFPVTAGDFTYYTDVRVG